MILIPAIDIKGGKVVRLFQGKFSDVTAYSDDPVAMARKWEKMGAQWLHVVDLDGAQTGEMKNIAVIKKIANSIRIPVQAGGGIRSEGIVRNLLDSNISRVILGTKVVPDGSLSLIGKMMLMALEIKEYGEDKIAVSLDCLNGYVTQRGWTETSGQKGADLAKDLESAGIKTIIYTDIARDGALTGPNFDGLREILDSVNISVIASGGISNINDVKELVRISKEYKGRLVGAITGKAIYEGKLDFAQALKVCSTNA